MKKIPNDILAALSAATFEGAEMRLSNQLDRSVYVRLKKIVEDAGGVWNRHAAAHVFASGDAAAAIDPILLTGVIMRGADLGQFDSPDDVVATVVSMAGISLGMTVLEPSAGLGNILVGLDLLATNSAFNYEHTANPLSVYACEIDPLRAGTIKEKFPHVRLRVGDFLEQNPDDMRTKFDRVVMNPPFAKQADIDHVMHAARFLKPGGRLVSVMSTGFTFRSDKKAKAFRQFLAYGSSSMVYDLPANSFRSAGTSVNTAVVVYNAPVA